MRVDDPVNAARGLGHAHVHGSSDFFVQDLQRSLFIEPHLSAEKALFIEISQNQVGIGNRHLRASEPVTDRTRHGPCALRSDLEQSGFGIDPNDTAAARADGFDPNFGEEDLVS